MSERLKREISFWCQAPALLQRSLLSPDCPTELFLRHALCEEITWEQSGRKCIQFWSKQSLCHISKSSGSPIWDTTQKFPYKRMLNSQ